MKKKINMHDNLPTGRVALATLLARRTRWWATSASVACLTGMAALIGAGPTTAPVADSPAPAPSTVAAAPTTMPVATAAVTTASRQQQDQYNQNRNDRNNRGNNNRGNNRGTRGGGNTGDAIAAANASGDPYVILQQRSIFIKGNQTTTPPSPDTRPQVPRDTVIGGRAATQLIFNGVTVINERPEAFVEDLVSNVVEKVAIGDGVAGGIVVAINFDDLAYQVRGQTKHVGLGQNFNGDSAFALSTPAAPTGASAAPVAPGNVVGAGASIPAAVAPTASGLSSEDILARMKAKRAQEAQQIGK